MYSSHYMIIKRVHFEPIHDAINLNVVSSSKVFIEFDVFLSNEYCSHKPFGLTFFFIPNVLKIGSDIELEKLPVHSSLVEPMVELLSNR